MKRLKMAVLVTALWGLIAAAIPVQAKTVHVLDVEGAIDPAVAEYVTSGITAANARSDSSLIVLRMNTPGGLSDSMDRIIQGILASKTPVCVYVAPAGARAASAGAVIALAAHVVAMAPGTNLGAATPVDIGGGDLNRKIRNDAAARARSLAALRNRPKDWPDRLVLKAESVSVDEAVEQGIADIKADSMKVLLREVDGRSVAGKILDVRGASEIPIEIPWRLKILHVLANPNLAYIFLLIAIYGIIAELSHPGVVFPGVAGSIAAVLAFYSLAVLSVNVSGLLLILLAVGLFIGDVLLPGHGTLSIGGVVAFVIGSVMLVDSPLGSVSPYLIAISTLVTVAFFGTLVTLALKTRTRPKYMGSESMVGRLAVAQTALDPEHGGRVIFEGTFWRAVPTEHIPQGETVEVAEVDGLTLRVQPYIPM